MIAPKFAAFLAIAAACLASLPGNTQAQPIDLSRAAIHCLTTDKQFLLRTPEILQEEVEKRTTLRWPVLMQTKAPASTVPSIILLRLEDSARLDAGARRLLASLPAPGKEGYQLLTLKDSRLLIVGRDARGLLYGAGRLLRQLEMRPGSILLPAPLSMSSSPAYPIRGHQLGYRPKTNSYDAFTVARFDQYIRDLALFGANSIEILPPRTDDEATSPHMVLPPAKMIVEQARICKSYGLDVWIWYPNVGKDYEHEDAIRQELKEREEIFASLPQLDNVFVPAGDPGEMDPGPLFRWLEKEAVVLRKYHPRAKIWVSPQAFKPQPEWYTSFFTEANRKYPWFGGVVFGPWVKVPLQQLRRQLDPSIPIRHYPDITHSLNCQYPIPHWDLAWGLTLGRECINPRPNDEKTIHNTFAPYCTGSISYSEGTNDDVNKFVWSDQDWDPSTPVIQTLRDYARLFLTPDMTEAAAQGIIGLENNLKGPAITNSGVERTLLQWQRLERQASPSLLANPRLQMCLIRAYFDAYTQRRLIHETELVQQARELLEDGTPETILQAKNILKKTTETTPLPSYKAKCLALADSLYRSIGAQLTIARHGGRQERGNFIDFIDYPLTDAPWILDQLSGIEPTDPERINKVQSILHRTDPGPGGFYDNLSEPLSFEKVVPGLPWAQDPGGLQSSHVGFGTGLEGISWLDNPMAPGFKGKVIPKSWMKQAMTLYDTPLKASYKNLDSTRNYLIRVTYTGRYRAHIRLTTGDGHLIHDYTETGKQPVFEYELPGSAIHNGRVTLVWQCRNGERGTQVAEVWLTPHTRP